MKDWNSVDEKWREQLQNKSEDIPEGLWSRIEERLEETPTRRFPIYWAAAAMLLLALGLSWNWNWTPKVAAKETAEVVKTKKTTEPEINTLPIVTQEENSTIAVAKLAVDKLEFTNPNVNLEAVAESTVGNVAESRPEKVVSAAPTLVEKKSDPEEIVTVRLDIDPVVEEEVKPALTQQKRRKSLLGKIVGEIRQVLDGEPINWQKLKEGNPAFENNIHNVANTYMKTEENLKRTLQIQ